MKISIYAMATETFVPMLRSLSNILDKGAEHARASKSDPSALVKARLAPDMYTLAQQVQLACTQACDSVAHLTGGEAPQFKNDEETLDALKARIAQNARLPAERARERIRRRRGSRHHDSDPRKQHASSI